MLNLKEMKIQIRYYFYSVKMIKIKRIYKCLGLVRIPRGNNATPRNITSEPMAKRKISTTNSVLLSLSTSLSHSLSLPNPCCWICLRYLCICDKSSVTAFALPTWQSCYKHNNRISCLWLVRNESWDEMIL